MLRVMSDMIECGKEAVKQSAPLVWEEKIASWLNRGKLLGNKVVSRDLYASPAVVSLLKEYKLSCMEPEGKVMVLYGEFGTGKSCTLYSIVHGPAVGSWCPLKSILVTPTESKTGNIWMGKLRNEMQYPEALKNDQFAEKLVRTAAKEKRIFEHVKEKVGKAPSPRPQIEIYGLVVPGDSFDDEKKPVIAIDNVEFEYEDDQRHEEKHSEFFDFMLALKDAAHAVGVVVILGTKNLALCKALSILNGFSKISPAIVSSSKDLAAHDKKFHVTDSGRRRPRTLALDSTMGWSTETMEECLVFKFPGLPRQSAKEIAQKYAGVGNIRDAVEDVRGVFEGLLGEKTLPKVTTKSTGTSTSIDSGEISRPSLADMNLNTSHTSGDESDEDQACLDAAMARCGLMD